MAVHYLNELGCPKLPFSVWLICGTLLSFALAGQCRPQNVVSPSNSTGLDHSPRDEISGTDTIIDSTKNSTSKSWFDRSIQVKCRCDYGCKDVAVDFILNEDVSQGYCASWITPNYDNNDKGEWCSRGWYNLDESRSYVSLTGSADSNRDYFIKWKGKWHRFSHGWFTSKVIIGSGSGCRKIYKA